MRLRIGFFVCVSFSLGNGVGEGMRIAIVQDSAFESGTQRESLERLARQIQRGLEDRERVALHVERMGEFALSQLKQALTMEAAVSKLEQELVEGQPSESWNGRLGKLENSAVRSDCSKKIRARLVFLRAAERWADGREPESRRRLERADVAQYLPGILESEPVWKLHRFSSFLGMVQGLALKERSTAFVGPELSESDAIYFLRKAEKQVELLRIEKDGSEFPLRSLSAVLLHELPDREVVYGGEIAGRIYRNLFVPEGNESPPAFRAPMDADVRTTGRQVPGEPWYNKSAFWIVGGTVVAVVAGTVAALHTKKNPPALGALHLEIE